MLAHLQHDTLANPYNDLWMGRVMVRADVLPNKTKLVTSTDTLIYDVNYQCPLKHDLYVWDSAVYYTKECTMDFRTKDIPFSFKDIGVRRALNINGARHAHRFSRIQHAGSYTSKHLYYPANPKMRSEFIR